MAIIKNQPEELTKVIMCYPKDKIEAVLSKVYNDMSRPNKRDYDSCKSLDKKVECIIKSAFYRPKLFAEMYKELFGEPVECSFEIAKEIAESCNAENYLERIAYFLLCCSNDAKYYEKNIMAFLSSEAISKTINHAWDLQASMSIGTSNEIEIISTQNTDNDTYTEDVDMQTYYIGYIKLQNNSFYNFYPIAKKDDNGLVSIDTDTLVELFPKYGSINLRTKKYNSSYNYLSSLEGIIDSYIGYNKTVPKLFAVKFNVDELTDNDDKDIKLRLEVDSIVGKDSLIDDIIFEATKLGIFRIVESEADNPNLVEGTIKIYNECYVDEDVLLYYGNKIYGPFKSQINRNNEMNIAPNIRSAKMPFVVDYWEDTDLQLCDTSITIFHSSYDDYFALVDVKKRKQEDLITESDIIDSVAKIIMDSDNDSKKFLRMLSTESPLFASALSNDVIKHREELALRLFDVEESRKEILKHFNEAVTSDDIAEVFKSRVVSREEYNESQSEKDNYSKTIEALKKELAEKSDCIDRYEQQNLEGSISSVDSQEYESLDLKYQQLKSDYELLQGSVKQYNKLQEEISGLKKLKESIDDDVQRANAKATQAKGNEIKAVSAMRSKLDSVILEMREQVSAAFDPVVSSALLNAAGRFDSDSEQMELNAKVDATIALSDTDLVFNGNQDDLLNYLVSNIQKYRKYSFNEIVNILICCTQNFLTVFSGEPGIGKTSICNIIANSLGLNLFEDYSAPNRYVLVPVEKGWATKRDLIGYYNPLTHRYDKSNSSVYNGLMLLDKEAEESKYPFVILLDEANLSQMEYYWADFMNITDRQSELCKINIGIEKDLVIPKTLRFLATINNDETTVDLSPRLIDRAWIIHLPNNPEIVTNIPSDYKSVFNRVITWKALCDTFDSKPEQKIDDDSNDILNSIYKEFGKYRYTVSPRVKTAIEHYVVVATSIMEDETGVSKSRIAIDYAVLQKLLPKISGVYEGVEPLLQRLSALAETYKLKITKKAIDDVIYRHTNEMDMGYCSFLN